MNASTPRGSRSPRERSERYLTARIRTEFLAAVDVAFGNMEYGIIGGAALAEYGSPRATSDVDVIVSQEVSLVVEDQLLSRGMVRTAGGGLGYVAPFSLVTYEHFVLLYFMLLDIVLPLPTTSHLFHTLPHYSLIGADGKLLRLLDI